MIPEIPQTQHAVQLTGPDKMIVNSQKEIHQPGPHQVLAKVEAVGLCFSDLKLLKQFDSHARKTPIVSGIDSKILDEIPSYCPNKKPGVPGHEACCVIVAVGEKVKYHKPGQRVLVQTDYRWLKTAASNAAFGYNFEGALQQYVLLDERVFVEPHSGESLLIPVDDKLSASAIALVEPWACVESSYISRERNHILSGGRTLVVAEGGYEIIGLEECFTANNIPANITAVCCDQSQLNKITRTGVKIINADSVGDLPNENFDDIIYFGCKKQVIEILNDKLAAGGIINIVLAGKNIGGEVSVGVGRVHYGGTRWTGTTAASAAQSYRNIPQTGELRPGDKVNIIGAAGPMGQMHTIRVICSGVEKLSIAACDFDDARLGVLEQKVKNIAQKNRVDIKFVNPQKKSPVEKFRYFAIMAPVADLVAGSIKNSMPETLINIFAGIPANVKHPVDLDRYIENRCFMFGTSGSSLSDMKVVLQKAVCGQLDTNLSVDAVSGIAGAIDGIRAVENRTMSGKIIVYPQIVNMPLIPLAEMRKHYPAVSDKIIDGLWTKQAEKELLKIICC